MPLKKEMNREKRSESFRGTRGKKERRARTAEEFFVEGKGVRSQEGKKRAFLLGKEKKKRRNGKSKK